MSNMSYCRFENTARDLGECLDAMNELYLNLGKDDYDQALSDSEQRAMEDIINISREILEIGDEVMEFCEKASDEK